MPLLLLYTVVYPLCYFLKRILGGYFTWPGIRPYAAPAQWEGPCENFLFPDLKKDFKVTNV